jgi:hypothetical protein
VSPEELLSLGEIMFAKPEPKVRRAGSDVSALAGLRPAPGEPYPIPDPTFIWKKLPTFIAWAFREDGILLAIEENPNLVQCEIQIVLIGPKTGWEKEVAAWNEKTGSVVDKISAANNTAPAVMTVSKHGQKACDTIYLSKAKALGFLTPMYDLVPQKRIS